MTARRYVWLPDEGFGHFKYIDDEDPHVHIDRHPPWEQRVALLCLIFLYPATLLVVSMDLLEWLWLGGIWPLVKLVIAMLLGAYGIEGALRIRSDSRYVP